MIRRLLVGTGCLALIGAALVLASASAQTTWVVKALDPPDAPTNAWDPGLPDLIEAQPGDTVSFEFDRARTIHNLFLRLPSGEDILLSAPPVCTGPLGICQPPPNHPAPIQYTLAEEGAYTYYCSLHGGDPQGNGMAGRIVVGEPSGGEEPDPMPNPGEPPAELESCPSRNAGKGGCAACATGGCSAAPGRRSGAPSDPYDEELEGSAGGAGHATQGG